MRESTRRRWREDARLVDLCLGGDARAWEVLIRRYRRLIYSIPSAYGLASDAADDVFQRVAIKWLENLPKLRRVEGLASWLVTTTRRECQATIRGGRRFESVDDADPGAEPAADPPDVAGAIEWIEAEHALALALESLDGLCRDLLVALHAEDPTPSYLELSERLGRPVGSLGPTRARCLAKLKKAYRARGGRRPWGRSDSGGDD